MAMKKNKSWRLVSSFLCALLSFFTSQVLAEGTLLFTKDVAFHCTEPTSEMKQYCDGLIQGYSDFAVMSDTVCIPPEVKSRDLANAFSTYIESTEAFKVDKPALFGAVEVFRTLYPC